MLSTIYHYGIVVPQLESAIAFYENVMGVTFLSPITTHYPRVVQKDGDAPFSARLTYSRSRIPAARPIHIELLEVTGQGMLSPQPSDQIHHLGAWADDPRRMAAELVSKGFEWEADCYHEDGSVPVAFVRRGQVRFELVDARRRPRWSEWVTGKIASPR